MPDEQKGSMLLCEEHEIALFDLINIWPVDHTSQRALMKDQYNTLAKWIEKEADSGMTPSHAIASTLTAAAINLALLIRLVQKDGKSGVQLASDLSTFFYREIEHVLEEVGKMKP